MSDAIAIPALVVAGADLALESRAALAGGVTLTLEDEGSRWSLRARSGETLAAVIGRAVPVRIGETLAGIACLGPDEWLADLPAGTALATGAGQPVSVVDVSARGVAIRIEGMRAVRVLAAGCPLDLERLAVGGVTRTVFETVEVIVWRARADLFRVLVWRSFAPWLWHALKAAQID